MTRLATKENTEARFLSKVIMTSPDMCWEWDGSINRYGYAVFWAHGRLVPASRFGYKQWVGEIPEGYEIDHVAARGCISRACVNPAHLEAVPPPVNNARRLWLKPQNGIERGNSSSKSGIRGVRAHGARWRAEAQHHGQRFSRRFATLEEAVAYLADVRTGLHGGLNNDQDVTSLDCA